MEGLKLKDKIWKWKERNMVPEVATLALSTDPEFESVKKRKVLQ